MEDRRYCSYELEQVSNGWLLVMRYDERFVFLTLEEALAKLAAVAFERAVKP